MVFCPMRLFLLDVYKRQVRINVEIPKSLNSKQKQALREFEATLGVKNYEKRKGFFERIKESMKGEDL